MPVKKAFALELYERMATIRAFETLVKREYLAGSLPGFVHLYIGEEASAVGVCAALRQDDQIESTHRGHGHCIAKGADLNRMMAEIYGKRTGLCKGKGGSMHIADFSVGMLGANGVVGGGYNLAVGAALANREILHNDKVSVVFFGDGAANRGTFHEAANAAASRGLPVVFVNENNGWASTTPYRTTTAVENIADYASAYHMPARIVDGSNVFEVYRAASEAVERARSGGGPSFIEVKTFRVEGHFVRDPEKYRDREYVEEMTRANDPFAVFERIAQAPGAEIEAAITADELAAARLRAEQKVLEAQRFALESPVPEPEEYLDDVYAPAEEVSFCAKAAQSGAARQITFGQATLEAMAEEMAADDTVFVMGEDIARQGGIFGQFTGLADRFPGRVIDTPISETFLAGGGTGAALAGAKPVVDLHYADFLGVCMDEVFNQMAKARYMSGGQAAVSLVLRAPDGLIGQGAAQHSQSVEAWVTHIPGLKVVAPSNAADAKAVLKAAIRDRDPVIYFEHKKLFRQLFDVPAAEDEQPYTIGKAKLLRGGTDITIVSYSLTMQAVLRAADELEARGVKCEVIDLVTLSPWDREAVISSVRRTGRLLVCQEAVLQSGFGAEIAATVAQQAFDALKAPVNRLGAPFTPVPFAAGMEERIRVHENEIIAAALEMMKQARPEG